MHRALMAYASDFHLVGTATLPHGVSFIKDDLEMASTIQERMIRARNPSAVRRGP